MILTSKNKYVINETFFKQELTNQAQRSACRWATLQELCITQEEEGEEETWELNHFYKNYMKQ